MKSLINKNNVRFVGKKIESNKDWSKDLFLLDEFLLSHTHLISYEQDIRILLEGGLKTNEAFYIGHFVTGAVFPNRIEENMVVRDYSAEHVKKIGPQNYSSFEELCCSVNKMAKELEIKGDCFGVISVLDLSRVYFELGYK